jgi:hypothetical protein
MSNKPGVDLRRLPGVLLRTWPAQTLAVLALVMGLFAMHGLASSHAGMSASMPAEAMSDPASAAGASTGGRLGVMNEGAARLATSVALVKRLPQTPTHEAVPLRRQIAPLTATDGAVQHGMGVVCLAVLTTALALLTLHRNVAVRWAAAPSLAASGVLRIAALPRPPPDLHRLCVSRT